jgi:hypothetical protein
MNGLRLPVLALVIVSMLSALEAKGQESSDELALLRTEVSKLRLQIAEARLELRKQMRLREQMQSFGTAEDPRADIAQWKLQASAVSHERARLRLQERRLKELGVSVRDAAADPVVAAPVETKIDPNVVPPKIEYKIGVIHLGQSIETTYVDPTTGAVLVSRYPNIDRHNIRVRGTIQNARPQPFRYTFEIRVAGRARSASSRPPIIGRWRYQTPLLSANQLHQFELKVPVTDVGDIYIFQIGNITWDQIGPAQSSPAAKPVPGGIKPAGKAPTPVK